MEMTIVSKHIGQSVKTVVVEFPTGISSDDPFPAHEEAARFAMEHCGETPDRLMDWDTDRDDANRIMVRLYTA